MLLALTIVAWGKHWSKSFCAGDHVLDVIDVGIVVVLDLVLDDGGVDGGDAGAFFRCDVNLVVFLVGGVAEGGKGRG